MPFLINTFLIPIETFLFFGYSGDTIELICKYDVGRDAIYSVKWYKVRGAFFQPSKFVLLVRIPR
jgi:hypothetical protein